MTQRSLSCSSFFPSFPNTSGKAMPTCPCCAPWGNMEPCLVFRTFCCLMNTSLMTCTSCLCQIAWVPLTSICRRHWTSMSFSTRLPGDARSCGTRGPTGQVRDTASTARAWVLDIPTGHEEFVQAELQATNEKHRSLVERIFLVQDLQSAPPFLRQHTRHVLPPRKSHQPRQSSLEPPTMLPRGRVSRASCASLHDLRRRMFGPDCHSRWVGVVCGAPPERGSWHTGPDGPTVSG